jgi:uncharacterized protein YeaO (DUF488 family)
MPIHLYRPYGDQPCPTGYRVLVDRIWPRGIRKSDLPHDEWPKHLAPSTVLRKWFAHDSTKWAEFKRRYRAELETQNAETTRLRKIADKGDLVLIYSARDLAHNQAVVLKELLESLK